MSSTLESLFVAQIAGNPAIGGPIGGSSSSLGGAPRIYPQEAPPNIAGGVPTPYLVYEVPEEQPLMGLGGSDPAGNCRTVIRVAIVAATYQQSRDIKAALRLPVGSGGPLNGWTIAPGAGAPGVDSCQVTEAKDLFLVPQDASDRGLNVINLDVILWTHLS